MQAATKKACANCERLQSELDDVQERFKRMEVTLETLQQQIAALRKDSSTSSKPPSRDIVKPKKDPPTNSASARKIGGQPGHPKHDRALFPPEQVTRFFTHELFACPHCSCTDLHHNAGLKPKVIQQVDVDLDEIPITVEQHTFPEYVCACCGKRFTDVVPTHIAQGGLVGANLTVVIAYLKVVCHASYSTVRTFVRDVLRITISRSQLCNLITKVSEMLEAPYNELLDHLADEPLLNVDETSHKDNGKLMWTWCFKAELYTLFKIDPRRSADVLIEVLGREFEGVLGCDCFGAYRRYMRECGVTLQFCLAHLIRDVKYLTTLPHEPTRIYGEKLREALRGLFWVIHDRDKYSEAHFTQALEAAREAVLSRATKDVPMSDAARTMEKRMVKYGKDYFTFITTPGMEPTNNVAEQAIRFVVIDRHITQGTRSEKGQRACERLWTMMASCTQQGRSVWEYLTTLVEATFQGEEPPSLLPA